MTRIIDLSSDETDLLQKTIDKEISYFSFLIKSLKGELESGTLTSTETAKKNRKNIFEYQKKIDLLEDILEKMEGK